MAADENDKLEKKIQGLISSINVLVDVIGERSRSQQPSSMFYARGLRDGEASEYGRDLKSLSSYEFDEIINKYIKSLKDAFDEVEADVKESAKKITAYNKKITSVKGKITRKEKKLSTNANLSDDEKTKLQNEINELKEQKKSLEEKREEEKVTQKAKQKESKEKFEKLEEVRTSKRARKKHYQEKHKEFIAELENNWKGFRPEEKKKYNNKRKNYIESELEKQDYIASTKLRNEASNDIARSGFENTGVGRYAQKVINRNQRFADMGNFANKLKTGGAEKISAALFGNGKTAAVAAKGLGAFGKGLGFVTKALGGFASGIMIAIDVIKMVGEAVNDWKKGTAEIYEHQTKQEQLLFELTKQRYILENQILIETISAIGDKQLKTLETQGSIMLDGLKLTTGQYVKSVEVALGPMMKGINESAYDAAMARVDAAAEYQKLQLHKGQRETAQRRYGELRDLQQQGKVAGLEADKNIAETAYTTSSREAVTEFQQGFAANHAWRNLIGNPKNNYYINSGNGRDVEEDKSSGNINSMTGERMKTPVNTKDAGIENINNPNAWGDLAEKYFGIQEGANAKRMAKLHNANQVQTQSADTFKTKTDALYQLATTQKEYANQILDKQLEIETQAAETVIDAAANVEKTFLQLAQGIEKYMENFDNVVNDLGINAGFTNQGQLLSYKYIIGDVVKDIGSKFGKEVEDFEKMSSSFITQTGRNRLFSKSDFGQMTALGMYLGDDGLASSYASEMEIFNAGVSDSVNMLDEALQDVNRMGLNGRKYTKTIVDNLKLSQKYNFRGGTKGLMEMAKWAENTRFNMNSLSGMLDKISEGGLEGVITQGAQFQVLGGHAAMNADPIAMMYERYANPDAFAKRMQDMTIGYGTVDRKTGETTFTGNEQMMMEQLAKVQGRSVEDVMNEARARNKKEVVIKHLTGNFDEDQQALISNNATYNREKEKFQIKVKRGNEYQDVDVDTLTPEDLKNIMPEKHNERMEDYMATIVSLLNQMKGEETREKMTLGLAAFEKMMDNYRERIKLSQDNFADNYDTYLAETKQGMEKATSAFQDYIDRFKQGHDAVDATRQEIETQANNIATALADTEKIIRDANVEIANAAKKGKEYEDKSKKTAEGAAKVDVSINQQNRKKAQDEIDKWKKTHTKIEEKDVWNHFGLRWDREKKEVPLYSKEELEKYKNETYQKYGIKDGIISNNNQPIIAQASKVTKVNDGVSNLVQSHKKDSAIFAKEGGPFDKLFNGVFQKIDKVHDALYNNPLSSGVRKTRNTIGDLWGHVLHGSNYKNIRQKELPIAQQWRRSFSSQGRSFEDVVNEVRARNRQSVFLPQQNRYDNSYSSNTFGGNNGVIKFETLNVHFDGKLELVSRNGQSINIISELQNNPTLMRELSRMITKQVTSAMNGGRGTLAIGIPNV